MGREEPKPATVPKRVTGSGPQGAQATGQVPPRVKGCPWGVPMLRLLHALLRQAKEVPTA